MIATIVGFSGSQLGASERQLRDGEGLLIEYRELGAVEFHHGNCIGADEQFARIAKRLGYVVHAHPGDNPAKTSKFVSDVTYAVRPNMLRNEDIVAVSHVMISTPRLREKSDPYSGTWATIRRAKKAGIPITILDR